MSRRRIDYGVATIDLPADADDATIEAWNQQVLSSQRRAAAAYFSNQRMEREADAALTRQAGSQRGSGVRVKPTVDRTRAAVTLAGAAEQLGLSPDELRGRVVGRAKLAVKDGELLIRLSDLDALADEGVIPARSTVERSERMARAIGAEDRKRSAPVDARTAAAADAIGVDLPKAKRDSTDVDDRAAEAAKLIGLSGYPSGTSE